MDLPEHQTKIVCTIGPASSSESKLKQLIPAGLNVARLNFSHGDLEQHRNTIKNIRKAASDLNAIVNIMVDLPGPRIRVGDMGDEPVDIETGNFVYLTTDEVKGNSEIIPVNYSQLYDSLEPNSNVYLNDGFIQLLCHEITDKGARCEVLVGGILSSHKGMNLPRSKLFIDSITEKDLEFMDFALSEGIHTFSLSFIEKADDVKKAREFAASKGKNVYLIAKIERETAVQNIDAIIEEADAIMLARGDLGVEVPIEGVPILQKVIIHKANLAGKPVITATHMLESMIENNRPTRAEVTDVANAILDGTDAVMLSGETTIGKYPVASVRMMAEIAERTESWRNETGWGLDILTKGIDKIASSIRAKYNEGAVCTLGDDFGNINSSISDVIALQVNEAIQKLNVDYVITPTVSGRTPRHISRFKPKCWIYAMSKNSDICEQLALSYGVYPICVKDGKEDWENQAIDILKDMDIAYCGELVVLTQGASSESGSGTNLLKIFNIE
ncbi:pyruvate kinase [Methanohalophilus levihalophilus]|uniref:pyruvate kinase n=1 Tax=Methanohalophilus levihalophilus TaxID=1431282 RepID=UPI001AE107A6|nr:pyruvate kinase [Methanohalophilus levihalophilus]MBP2029767.1 pyruvate kinase [Methanohalophilus levihalophilus]